ncbi:MAG: hypothetical protein AB3N13_00215, partial [Arenibacterium sp.]
NRIGTCNGPIRMEKGAGPVIMLKEKSKPGHLSEKKVKFRIGDYPVENYENFKVGNRLRVVNNALHLVDLMAFWRSPTDNSTTTDCVTFPQKRKHT